MRLFQFVSLPCFWNSTHSSLRNCIRNKFCKIFIKEKRLLTSTNFLYSHNAFTFSNIRKFQTSCCRAEDTENLSGSQPKKRLLRKKAHKWKKSLNGKICSVVAYCSAEEYRMQLLVRALESQSLYKCVPLPEDAGNDLHLVIEDEGSGIPAHIYIFSEGTIVFWNVPDSKQKEMLNFVKPYEINSFDPAVVFDENEDLDYIYSEDETKLHDGCVILNSQTNTDLHTYTFSNSLAQSVKLGILEEALETYSSSLEWVTDKMKNGEKIKMSRREIFAKRGELFSLRHTINLSSDLLDTPDFYWERKDLEILFHQTSNYLDIPKRIRTLNVRLSYCSELVDLLSNHMNDEHHVRLEWMIIILIMVEVVFECMHFMERFSN